MMSEPIDDYTGRRMTLDSGKVEHCDSCTDEITGDYIRVADVSPDGTQVVPVDGIIVDFIYCLECGTDENILSDYFDEWEYFQDPDSGIGIVVNHFRDECIGSSGELLKGVPQLNLYVVPKDKVANNDWHNDMEILEMSDEWKSQPREKE